MMRYRFAAMSWTGVAAMACVLSATGCNVQVDKNKDGEDKNVKITTPLGGIHVTKSDTTAVDTGISVYPGAQLSSSDKSNDRSADVNMGFGDWKLRVKVANYQTADPEQRVMDYYRKSLASYGDVLECRGNRPVGQLNVTSEGLTCNEDGQGHAAKVNIDHGDVQLKAGSRRRQHIVAFSDEKGAGTKFTLITLELPRGMHESEKESN